MTGSITAIVAGATTTIVRLDCNGTAITASITNAAEKRGLSFSLAATPIVGAFGVVI